MPEYLAPGVYVEEVSYRASTIEGVPTSTTGFAGLAPFGPVYYPGGPSTCEPLLVTSFPEFELAYGKLDQIFVGGEWRLPYLAHAARAFFLNGGQLLYVSRVFKPTPGDTPSASRRPRSPVPTPTPSTATWRARWPGSMGNVAVTTTVTRSQTSASHPAGPRRSRTRPSHGHASSRWCPPRRHAARDRRLRSTTTAPDRPGGPGSATRRSCRTTAARRPAERDGPALDRPAQRARSPSTPSAPTASCRLGSTRTHPQFIQKVLDRDHPVDQNAISLARPDFGTVARRDAAISLLLGLVGTGVTADDLSA